MPTRISRGLSRNGRRGGGGAGAGPACRRGLIDVTVACVITALHAARIAPSACSLLRVQQLLEFVGELIDVAEMTIHRGEPDVGDFVEPFQLLHHEAADLGGGDFLFGALLQSCLDAVGDALQSSHADRPLLAPLQQARNQLLPVEPLTGAVFLDHHVRALLDPFVAGEALAAAETLTPTADHFPFFRLAGIDHLVAEVRAVGTLHAVTPMTLAARTPAPAS